MVERGGGARFLFETGQSIGVCPDVGGQNLDRHLTAQSRVAGTIHFAHPTGAERSDHLIGAEPLACRERHQKLDHYEAVVVGVRKAAKEREKGRAATDVESLSHQRRAIRHGVATLVTRLAGREPMRRLALLTTVAIRACAIAVRPKAVTDGRLDGNAHPAVVLLLMEVEHAPAFRCSATLLSPTIVLTAGHCTNNFPGSLYMGMRVFTESDVEAGIGTTNNYPFAGPKCRRSDNVVGGASALRTPEPSPARRGRVCGAVGAVHSAGVTGRPASGGRSIRSAKGATRTERHDVHRRRIRAAGKLPGSGVLSGQQPQNAHVGDTQSDSDQRPPGTQAGSRCLPSNNHSTGGNCFH